MYGSQQNITAYRLHASVPWLLNNSIFIVFIVYSRVNSNDAIKTKECLLINLKKLISDNTIFFFVYRSLNVLGDISVVIEVPGRGMQIYPSIVMVVFARTVQIMKNDPHRCFISHPILGLLRFYMYNFSYMTSQVRRYCNKTGNHAHLWIDFAQTLRFIQSTKMSITMVFGVAMTTD